MALAAFGVVLLAGCAGSAPSIAPAPAVSAASTPPGQVRITGAVDRPSTLSVAALAAMPSQMVAVEFGTDKGTERHTYLGAPLIGLIDRAGPVLTPGTKHDELSLGVLVVGADGYRTLLSYGELSPSFGNIGVLLATSQDGKPLTRPRWCCRTTSRVAGTSRTWSRSTSFTRPPYADPVWVDWHGELLSQLVFYWEQSLRPRLDGLTDEEYLWEPVSGCWSVRPQIDGTTTIDWAFPTPDPAPFTTIAWRICHLAGPCLAMRVSSHFGDGSWTPDRRDWPITAAGGIDFLERGYHAWHDAVRRGGIERLCRPTGPAEGPYARHPFATLVLHLNRELMHHGGEIGTLRDLYLRR